MSDVPQPIGHLLRTLDRLIEERFTKALESRRLSRRQWHLLNVLAETQSTLGQLDKAIAPYLDESARETSEPYLEPLLSGGLVTEKGGVYRLTDAGRTECRAARQAVEGVREMTVQGLESGEYERTVRCLEAMIDNLSA